jgi:hypothetical protein
MAPPSATGLIAEASRSASQHGGSVRFPDALPGASLGLHSAPRSTALPSGLGDQDDDVFPMRERIRLRDSFGLALLELRARNAEFQNLGKGPWALFIGIAVHWQGNAEAWPSQDTLSRFSGWSTRAVRDQADSLERRGFIRVRRERRADGSERIFYAPGLVTLAALASFVERFPRERAKVRRPEAPLTRIAELTRTHPPENHAGTPPETLSGELRDQDQIKPSSCDARRAGAPNDGREEQAAQVTEDDRDAARMALGERMTRKYPTRPAPRYFDAGDIALVAACASAIQGDKDARVRALSDAIAGAFAASKDGPPTVRFIWGKLEHFLDHVERGRRGRLAEERRERLRGFHDGGSQAPSPQPVADAPAVSQAQMKADLERLFGPGFGRTFAASARFALTSGKAERGPWLASGREPTTGKRYAGPRNGSMKASTS